MTKAPPNWITAVFIDDAYIVGLEPDSFMQFFTDEGIRKRTKSGRGWDTNVASGTEKENAP